MEKLQMCRICLVENVRMYVVGNKNLHELYEKLTDIPFVTEDRRPILACFVCCAQLKKCYQLQKKCLEAEELFAQMLNEMYEPKPLINQDYLEVAHGFIKTPIDNISIAEVGQTDSVVVKEELPDVCERQDDILVPKEERLSDDDLEAVHQHNNYLEIEYMPPHQSGSQSEDDVPLLEVKTEVEEEQEVHEKKPKTEKTKIIGFTTPGAPVAKKPKLPTRRTKLEDTISVESKKADSKIIQNPQSHTSKPVKPVNDTRPRVQNSINNTAVDIDCPTNSNQDFSCKVRHNKGSDSNGESYKCDVCQRSLSRKYSLIKHNRIHTGERPYTCDVCQRTFRLKGDYTVHIRTHTGEKPYKCDICQRSFSKKDNLMTHIRIHTGEKPYTCDVCQRSFRLKGDHTVHIRIHTGEKPYKCDVCQRSFRVKADHTVHIRKHTGEKPYTCDLCHSSFRKNSDLISHIRIHSGKKPYKCEVCQSSFSTNSGLTKHIRTHTGEKPYKCDVCQRSFKQMATLTSHVRIHTGEKPYKCDVCQRAFTHLSSFKKHVGRVHPSE